MFSNNFLWYPISSNYLLDLYPSAAQAFSLRLLRSAYTGNCIRVRRSSDNTEQDIGFLNTVLDTASLFSFVGAGDGFVTVWYDQSGNGNNASQPTASYQPQIISSGSILTSNGKPTILFGSGTQRVFTPVSVLNSQPTVSLFATWTISDGTADGGVYGRFGSAGLGLELISQTASPTLLNINGGTRTTGSTLASRLWTSAIQTITSILGNSTSVAAYKNNSAVTLADSSAMPTLNNNIGVTLGGYKFFVPQNNMTGNIQEFIIWTTDQTPNSSNINNNINLYYGTY